MKNFNLKMLATSVVAIALVFTSCKKGETGDQGPAGTAGTNGVVPTYTDGYVKGNVAGTRQDGTAFNETFEFKNYYTSTSGVLDSNNAVSYDFVIKRSADVFDENSATVTVNTTSKTATTGTFTMNEFKFTKALSSTQKFVFTVSGSPSATITGLSYNTSTRVFTGTYSLTVPGFQNSTGNSATINGSFQATMVQMYNLVKDHKDVTSLND